MAMEARKPIFQLKASDGAIGAHTNSVKECGNDFRKLAENIIKAMTKETTNLSDPATVG